MSNSNSVISVPIDVKWGTKDLENVLGVSSGEWSYLCGNAHGRTNKWAKYKPVILDKFFTTDTPEWWRAKDLSCGITMPSYGQVGLMVTAARAGTISDWVYVAPNGGQSSPYRITDFNGYNHNALVPIIPSGQGITYIEDTNRFVVYFYSQGGIGDMLNLKDIRSVMGYLGDLYFGICLYNSTKYYASTQEAYFKTIDDFYVSFNGASSTMAGVYTMFPFFSTTKLSIGDEGIGTLYPMIFAKDSITVQVRPANITIYGYAFWNVNNMNQLCYGFTFINNTSVQISTGQIQINLMDSSKFIIWTKYIDSKTIPARNQYDSGMLFETPAADIRSKAKYFQVKIENYGGMYYETVIGTGDPNNP